MGIISDMHQDRQLQRAIGKVQLLRQLYGLPSRRLSRRALRRIAGRVVAALVLDYGDDDGILPPELAEEVELMEAELNIAHPVVDGRLLVSEMA